MYSQNQEEGIYVRMYNNNAHTCIIQTDLTLRAPSVCISSFFTLSSQVQMYLTETWVSNLRSSIHSCLETVRKGWFNLEETNFEVYQGSKLKKLMELTKFSMQVRILMLFYLVGFV